MLVAWVLSMFQMSYIRALSCSHPQSIAARATKGDLGAHLWPKLAALVFRGLSRELENRIHWVEVVLPKSDCMRHDQISGLEKI